MCVCMRLPAYVLHVVSLSRCGPAALQWYMWPSQTRTQCQR